MKGRLVLIFSLLFFQFFSQNLTTEGKYIVNSSGDHVLLKGFNFGGWMLQEPYMFQFSGAAISQTDFKNKLINFIGEENTNEFYNLLFLYFIPVFIFLPIFFGSLPNFDGARNEPKLKL